MRAARRHCGRLMPKAASGCLASARRSTGSASDSAASASSRAKMPSRQPVERHAGGIVDRKAPAAKLGRDAPGDGAVGRHQRGASRPASPPPRAAPARSPSPPPARCAPRAGRRRPWRRSASAAAVSAQRSVVSAGRRASATKPAAGGKRRAGGGQRLDVFAQDAELADRAASGRTADGRRRSAARSSASPIASQVSASRSWSRPGSTTAPSAWRAIALSRAAVAGIEPVEPAATTGPAEPRRRGADQRVAAHRRVDQADLGEMGRPLLGDDLQEVERDLVVAGMLRPARARASRCHGMPAVSMSSRSRARSPASRAASAAEAGISSGSSGASASGAWRTRPRPGEDQLRQRQPALQRR